MKKIAIGFLGNILYDTRTYNLYHILKSKGYDVTFNGFDWLTPDFETYKNESIEIEKLEKTKFSLLFYVKFALKLISKLFKQNADIYFASDVYSLPFCTIVAKLKRKKIFYDAREVYTELPAIQTKRIVKVLMKIIEGHYIKKTNLVLTTGHLDSLYIEKLYKLEKTYVLRNLPLFNKKFNSIDLNKKYKIPEDRIKLIYQGVIVKGRGLETSFKIVQKVEKVVLFIFGGGEDEVYYKDLANQMGVSDKVFFAGKIKQDELISYTSGADAGLAIIDNVSINSLYALPNKIFEYIMAEIPIIVSNMPQMVEIIDEYKVGAVVNESDIDELIKLIMSWQNDKEKYNLLKLNCKKASEKLNWEVEFSTIEGFFK